MIYISFFVVQLLLLLLMWYWISSSRVFLLCEKFMCNCSYVMHLCSYEFGLISSFSSLFLTVCVGLCVSACVSYAYFSLLWSSVLWFCPLQFFKESWFCFRFICGHRKSFFFLDETFGGLNSVAFVQLLSTNNWLISMKKQFFSTQNMFLDWFESVLNAMLLKRWTHARYTLSSLYINYCCTLYMRL